MKPFNELTPDEQAKIVTFIDGGQVYYYSKITALTSKTMTYNGETFDITGNSLAATIREGLTTYEIYKLSMASFDAEKIFRETTSDTIKEYYDDKFSALVNDFTEFKDKALKHIEATTYSMGAADDLVKGVLTDISSFRNTLHSNATNLDLTAISEEFHSKLEDVKVVRDKFTRELTPVQKELGSLIRSLKQIVIPTD